MVITIGAEKGGVAKTRLATHIAALAAANDVDVVLLDTDKQGSAMSWAKIRNDEGVTPSIPVLALPPNPARELADLSKRYTLVVVDIGAQNYRTMLECALLSDLVLVPCGADQQEVESTLNVFDTLKQMGPRHESGEIPAHVVLTRVSPIEGSKATAELRDFFAGEGAPLRSLVDIALELGSASGVSTCQVVLEKLSAGPSPEQLAALAGGIADEPTRSAFLTLVTDIDRVVSSCVSAGAIDPDAVAQLRTTTAVVETRLGQMS